MRSLSKAFLALTLLLAGCGEQPEKVSHLRKCDTFRIVSLAPNITEILYALGMSNQVIGVSKYSTYPPEAAKKPAVGGTYDPNWERIVSLQPDLVIGLESQEEIAAQLKQLGIDFLGVPHERVEEIMDSILMIGEACGAQAEAQQLFQTLEKTALRHRNFSNGWKPRVLVCIGHDEQLTRMYVAAHNTFYDDLINLAGGTNACVQTAVKYPEISPEGLRAIKPDLVIDLVPNPGSRLNLQPEKLSKDWKPCKAVVMTNSYAFIPGPRFGLLLEDFIKAIHE
jgi:iron complex transport system substrate-binding protein